MITPINAGNCWKKLFTIVNLVQTLGADLYSGLKPRC